MSVFADLIGQDDARGVLSNAAAGIGMTHAWLFIGPPGSGRSVAASAFASALQCDHHTGCGQCSSCHLVQSGSHADVQRIIPEGLSIGVGEVRRVITMASRAPSGGKWQILILEDADRLTESAGNALLKAIEEPPERTVFLLCAPSDNPQELSITIRSRCRVVSLRQPPKDAIARLLMDSEQLPAGEAELYAAAAQGHIGRARRLATDETARAKRRDVLAIPRQLTGISACFSAAVELIEAAEAEASDANTERSSAERQSLEMALGKGGTGKGASKAARGSAAALKDLEKRQKTRDTRSQRDSLDRALVDLAAFYRDALVAGFGSPVEPVHPDMVEVSRSAASKMSPESLLRRISAVLECREAIDRNVRPRIAVEALMTRLWTGN
ncbi:DNA polymerase III subunit delta' [Natronoglycomyces albus]|uniref:DNA polymerase III subunit delta n=1 Tax=Natronoglycomyces albus TaxID=2811108 RepID=A0A895XK17_9ACTN|nr:DNA polymerase III subunit delta' [Natronoglycomyces albus]QSB05684.1 DNA polymerase III subunit delta' [Natronoglycomyces albus]